MNKLKNIGISALAGTLVSLSAAQAGGVSVTGSWELSYTNLDNNSVTGNKIGMNKNITFGASGDVSDGGGVTWATTVAASDAMGLTSASMNINMGGIATLAYDSGTGGYGATAVDNIVPTAWEEVDAGFSTGITDVGAVSKTKGVVNLTVKAPTAGTALSISWASKMGAGHQGDGATGGPADAADGHGIDMVIDFVNYSAPHAGIRFGMAGEVELKKETCKKLKKSLDNGRDAEQASCNGGYKDHPYGGTAYFTLKLGPLSLGTQATFKDPMDPTAAGIKNKRSIMGGAALSFGSTASISYGEAWDRYRYNTNLRGPESSTYETMKFRGWSAAINMGPVALKGYRNHVVGKGLYDHPKTHSEVNLSIAF